MFVAGFASQQTLSSPPNHPPKRQQPPSPPLPPAPPRAHQRLAVLAPHHAAARAAHGAVQNTAGRDVLHVQVVPLAALDVLGPREQPLVGGRLQGVEHVEGRADLAAARVLVEEHLLGGGGGGGGGAGGSAVAAARGERRRRGALGQRPGRGGRADVGLVLAAGARARVVPVPFIASGDARVLLLDARAHLLVQARAQRRRGVERGGGVVVLGLEVGEDVGVGACVVAQPVVIVRARVAVCLDDVRTARRDGRRRERGGERGGGGVVARMVLTVLARRRLGVGRGFALARRRRVARAAAAGGQSEQQQRERARRPPLPARRRCLHQAGPLSRACQRGV